MFLSGLDELNKKLLALLVENAGTAIRRSEKSWGTPGWQLKTMWTPWKNGA